MLKDSAQPASVSRETAEHYRWGNDCDGWHLVKDANLSVIEELLPSGAMRSPSLSQKAQQFFYILSGEVMMEVEGQTRCFALAAESTSCPEPAIGSAIPPRVPRVFSSSRSRPATAIASQNDCAQRKR